MLMQGIGKFRSPDLGMECEFIYDREKKNCTIWNNNKPVEEILPLPIHWLDRKLNERGYLNENEKKISY